MNIRVKLKYITEEHTYIGYYDRPNCTSGDSIYNTVFPDRNEQFGYKLNALKDQLQQDGVGIDVQKYEEPIDIRSPHRRYQIRTMGNVKGYSINYYGPKDKLVYLMKQIADPFGPPDRIVPGESFKGSTPGTYMKHIFENIAGYVTAQKYARELRTQFERELTINKYTNDTGHNVIDQQITFKPRS